MSTKGLNQSIEVRKKISIANTKDRTVLHQKIKEYIEKLIPEDYPSLTACAIYCGISEKMLLAYELRTQEDSEIRIMLDQIRDIQKQNLMKNGLFKSYDSGLSKFLLTSNHGMRENPTSLTQNNTFNVSPEILAEAIEISRNKKS
jgi:hypothetical protein